MTRETENQKPDDFADRKDLCALIGLTLVELQSVEKILRSCMGVVFQDSSGNPLEDLRNPKTRRKTIGQFLTVLRQKSQIDPKFDEILGNFLTHRNDFVHDLLGDRRMKLSSSLGRRNLRVFVALLRSETDTVGKAMMGFLMVWADPQKFADLSKVRVQFAEGSWLGDAEQIFAPHASKLVRPKP